MPKKPLGYVSYADIALPPESRPPPTYVKLADIPAVVDECRRKRGLPPRPKPPEGLSSAERMAWTLRQLRHQIEAQGKMLAALRARQKR